VASAAIRNGLRLWEAHSGQLIRELKGHTGSVEAITFTRDGSQLISGADDDTVRIWDVHGEGCRVLTGHAKDVMCVALNPDESRLASGSQDDSVRIWDFRTGELVQNVSMGFDVWSVDYSPDGRLLAVATEDKTIRLLDASTGQKLDTMRAFGAEIVYSSGQEGSDGAILLCRKLLAEASRGEVVTAANLNSPANPFSSTLTSLML
jgi:WD40 repeat protein